MPKQEGQDAESIINQTAAQKKATASTKQPWSIPMPISYFDQILNQKQAQDRANQKYAFTPNVPMPSIAQYNGLSDTPYGPNFMTPPMSSTQQPGGNPTPVQKADTRFDVATIQNGMMQNGGRMNADLDVQSLMDNPFIREAINTRFPGGVTYEDVMNYLMDNYSWLFPERTGAMPTPPPSPDVPDNSGGATIPLPDYGGWGGGGYSQYNGYNDSGLINWRI